MKRRHILISLLFLALLSACGSDQPHAPYYQGIKIGKPYEVAGQVYVPKYTPTYDEIGVASWYGPGFHGELTASGERYNQNALTAAHKTLPLPSIVRVTNLDNGRSVIVRINDRGPFKRERIIDLSKAAAIELGMIKYGTAKVRVQYLDQETREYVSKMPNGKESLLALDRAASQNGYIVADANALNAVTTPSVAPVSESDSQPAVESKPIEPPPVKQSNQVVGDLAMDHPYVQPTLSSPSPASVAISPASHEDIFAVADAQPVNQAANPIVQTQEAAGKYFIQAGTFGVKGNATRMLQELEETVSAKIVEDTSRERKMYRVLAGPFSSHTEAQGMLSRLGLPGALIVRD